MWLKYRHGYASHQGEWEWTEVGGADQQAINDIVDELEAQYSYSDKYRGIEQGALVEFPPAWVIEGELSSAVSTIVHINERIVQLEAQLPKCQLCPNCGATPTFGKHATDADAALALAKEGLYFIASRNEVELKTCEECGRPRCIVPFSDQDLKPRAIVTRARKKATK